jgi:hypothetical protein
MKTNTRFWKYLAQFLLEWETFKTKLLKKSKHTFYIKSLFLQNRTVCEIMWKNIAERGRPQVTI